MVTDMHYRLGRDDGSMNATQFITQEEAERARDDVYGVDAGERGVRVVRVTTTFEVVA